MASLLRQIVAGPRLRHPEAGLDLCYVTDNIIATSGPSSAYPQRAYRNPTDALVKFLDSKHAENWGIWEFRAEGTGYPDSEVYNRIHHFPWPDHHPPPFAIIPPLIASMRNWLKDDEAKGRVVVVHCKAGKGRSGTVACSYLMSEEGWTREEAIQRFTERRMRQGFGAGVSIPSQLRWLRYVDRWANEMGKMYVDRKVEILEVHVWGLRDGVKVAVEGYVDEGRKIKTYHVFKKKERIIVDNGKEKDVGEVISPPKSTETASSLPGLPGNQPEDRSAELTNPNTTEPGGPAVIFRPSVPIIILTSDVNIDFERRNKAAYTGWTMVTSVAHVWFNTYFEGGDKENSGVFELEWDALDGIKGSSRKGTRSLDKIAVVWRYPGADKASGVVAPGKVIAEPKKGEPVEEGKPADWRGAKTVSPSASGTHLGKDLGLRADNPVSAEVSRASSLHNAEAKETEKNNGEANDDARSDLEGVRRHIPQEEDSTQNDPGDNSEGEGQWVETGNSEDGENEPSHENEQPEQSVGNVGLGKVSAIVKGLQTTKSGGGKDER